MWRPSALAVLVAWLGACGSGAKPATDAGFDAWPDAYQVRADGAMDAPGEDAGVDAPACFPLFHACATTNECCAPYRCLDVTGTLACQLEGPPVDGGP